MNNARVQFTREIPLSDQLVCATVSGNPPTVSVLQNQTNSTLSMPGTITDSANGKQALALPTTTTVGSGLKMGLGYSDML